MVEDIGGVNLASFLTGNNLLWLVVFITTVGTLYVKLRSYLSNKNKQYMEKVADDTTKKITDNVTRDNQVSEININQAINDRFEKELEKIHQCNERIENKIDENSEKLNELDKMVAVHMAESKEQTKTLDRVSSIVDSLS